MCLDRSPEKAVTVLDASAVRDSQLHYIQGVCIHVVEEWGGCLSCLKLAQDR